MAQGTWREDVDENKRLQELQKPGAMLFGKVERKQKIQLEDSTGFEDLQAQFDSAENRGRTVRQEVSDYNGLGPGRVIIKSKTNTPAGIFFYPDDPDFDKKAVESVAGWGRAFNAPAEFAPLLGVAAGAKNIFTKVQSNRQWTVPEVKGGVPRIDQPLTAPPWQTINMFKSGSKTSAIMTNLLKATGNLKTTASSINKNIETGLQSFVVKVAQRQPGMADTSVAQILNQEGLVHNIFTEGSSTANAVSNLELPTPASSGIAKRMVTGTSRAHKSMRERISADNPTALAYRELITKYDKLKENIGDATLDTVISQAEFEADVRQLIKLKSKEGGLDLPNKTSFSKELGNFAIDGIVQRWGSKGVLKPATSERVEDQGQFPATVEFDVERPKWKDFVNSIRHKTALKLGLKKPEKDHLIRLKNQIAILGNTLNAAGEFVRRPAKFMDQLALELHRRGHHLGDQNLNWLMMSEKAHRTGKYSRHVVSQDMTDAELPKTLAEAQQQQLFLYDGRTIIAEHKKGKYYLDGVQIKPKEIKEKGNYFFAGREYEKGQRQGLSLTTRKILAKIDNPKDLADAYELFATDAGAHEIMSGIQTAASFIYDKDAELDALSKQIRNENIPNMIKFLEYTLKNVPQYKDDPVYTKLLNRFTDKLKQNMTEYREALELDATRPLLYQETKQDARI
jgi:hypothetical protein